MYLFKHIQLCWCLLVNYFLYQNTTIAPKSNMKHTVINHNTNFNHFFYQQHPLYMFKWIESLLVWFSHEHTKDIVFSTRQQFHTLTNPLAKHNPPKLPPNSANKWSNQHNHHKLTRNQQTTTLKLCK